MIIDSSVLVAILHGDSDAKKYVDLLAVSRVLKRLSAANFLESAIVIDSRNDPIVSRKFDEFISKSNILIEPVTEQQARIAREAYRDFGKGSGHKAKLNYGDCFAYALAKDKNEPLLFKGNDFCHTDIKPYE